MTKDQISGVADRLLVVLATYMVAKGYITQSQAAEYIPLVLALASAIYGWYVNRPVAIAQSAAALPGTTVITTPDIARATPMEGNIIANTENKVVAR